MLSKMVKKWQTRESINYKNISIKNTQPNRTKRSFSSAIYSWEGLNLLTNEEFYKTLNEEIDDIKTRVL